MSEISQPNIERLRQTARVLHQVKREEKPFSLDTWVNSLEEFDFFIASGDLQHECGTVCCAIGWAAQDPWHNAEGLYLLDAPSAFRVPVFNRSRSWEALRNYFGIPIEDTKFLFCHEKYRSRGATKISTVIRRLERYIVTACERVSE
jgi:hypothetical protein